MAVDAPFSAGAAAKAVDRFPVSHSWPVEAPTAPLAVAVAATEGSDSWYADTGDPRRPYNGPADTHCGVLR